MEYKSNLIAFTVEFRGSELKLNLPEDTSFGELAATLEEKLQVIRKTQKLFIRSRDGEQRYVNFASLEVANKELRLRDAGLTDVFEILYMFLVF